jgi:SPP1 gp7 family putative phage head morphogenesis protein
VWDVRPDAVNPRDAIAWFRQRLPLLDAEYRALTADARRLAFTVSGLATLDLVQDVMNRIQAALENGESFEAWRTALPAQIGNAWGQDSGFRLKTIFDTNIQSAYGAGRWKAANALRDERPFGGLEVVLDGRTSPICSRLVGVILPLEEIEKRRWIPPLHFRCRTALVTYSRDQVARRITQKVPEVQPLEGFGQPPTERDWKPDPNKYDPVLWAVYQRSRDGTMPDVQGERIRVGKHVGQVPSVLSSADTQRVLRSINLVGADDWLAANPLEQIALDRGVPGAMRGTLAQYVRQPSGQAMIQLDVSRPRETFGQRYVPGGDLPETVSSLGADRVEAVRRSLIHELGHHVIALFVYGTEWESAMRAARQLGGRVSRRAMKNWQEQFCENLVAYHFERTMLLTLDPDGFAMIEQIRKELGWKP